MDRRDAVFGLLALGTGIPLAAFAQQPLMVPRIGLLANGSAHPHLPRPVEALIDGLRVLGYIEGKTIWIEYRWAEGKSERLPALAADLARIKVAVIVAAGDAPTRAARAATSTIPIVMATSGDAVGAGFVSSLARLGGNITGMTAINPDLAAKRLQLLRELVPGISRIGILRNPGDTAHALDLNAALLAASKLEMTLQPVELRTAAAVSEAFRILARSNVQALIVFNDTTTVEARSRIVELAARQRMPTMYEASEWVDAGGLMSYGVSHVDLFRQSAAQVAKILRGAKPSDIPVEQPSKLRLAINKEVANSLNLSIPTSVLLRADQVIE
jgi:putative ABC transport system substrate-binding protein